MPDDIHQSLKEGYSENLVVYPGRKALHVFDIDKRKWLLHSKQAGHQYQDIYFRVSGTYEGEGEDEEESEDSDSDLEDDQVEHPHNNQQIQP